MDDAPAAQAVEHLQAAARELIAAARLFLDAAEELVDDPAVVREAATVAGGVVGDLVAELRRAGRGRSTGWRPFEADLDERDGAPGGQGADEAAASQARRGADLAEDGTGEPIDLRSRSGRGRPDRATQGRVKRIDVQ